MAQLPRFGSAEVATKSDLADLRTELGAVNQRLDRLFGIETSMIGVIVSVA